MTQPDLTRIAEHFSGILKELGADLNSEGMKETPLRAARALVVCHDRVIVERINEVGLREHQSLPIPMSVTIAYVPDKQTLGLSKLSRIAGHFARRGQNQERTAHLIAAFIEQTVEPLGVAVLIDGKHMCAMARGVRGSHSTMKVSVMHDAFQNDQNLRNELPARLALTKGAARQESVGFRRPKASIAAYIIPRLDRIETMRLQQGFIEAATEVRQAAINLCERSCTPL